MEKSEPYRKAIEQCFKTNIVTTEDFLAHGNWFTEEIDRITSDLQKGLARKRHVLVIGGAGYIGAVLCRKLIAEGFMVRALDCLLYDNGSSVAGMLEDARFSFVRGDFCDRKTLTHCMEGITDVILLAALVGDPICRKHPDDAKRINLQGTIGLVETLTRTNLNKLVFLSTCSNYGLRSDGDLATEQTELNPQSLYAETKVMSEQYLLENNDKLDFSTTILRVSTAYGLSDRMRFDLTIADFTRQLFLGNELLVYDENTWRPYCHVCDVSDAIIRVLRESKSKVNGEIFNIGSRDENYTKKMVVDSILTHLEDRRVSYKEGGTDPRNYKVSFEKASQLLGFQGKYSVTDWVPKLIYALNNGAFDDVEERKGFYGNYAVSGL